MKKPARIKFKLRLPLIPAKKVHIPKTWYNRKALKNDLRKELEW